MSLSFQRKKELCIEHRARAYRECVDFLRPKIGADFRLGEWTGRTLHAYDAQWSPPRHPDAGWDWPAAFRDHRDFDALPLVMWTPGDRLSGLGLATVSGKAVVIKFLEGDPRADCPLRGQRALIALEASARYAQMLGRTELRVHPVNSSLERLYQEAYGFTREAPRIGAPFLRKEV